MFISDVLYNTRNKELELELERGIHPQLPTSCFRFYLPCHKKSWYYYCSSFVPEKITLYTVCLSFRSKYNNYLLSPREICHIADSFVDRLFQLRRIQLSNFSWIIASHSPKHVVASDFHSMTDWRIFQFLLNQYTNVNNVRFSKYAIALELVLLLITVYHTKRLTHSFWAHQLSA